MEKEGGGAEGDRNIPVISNTSQGVVPRHEGGEEAPVATSLDEGRPGSSGCVVQPSEAEEQEGHVKEEEQEEECHGGAQRTHHQDGGEDEPSHEEEAQGVGEVIGVGACAAVRRSDVEAAWGEDDGDGDPEAAVRGERGGTECVSYGHLPMWWLAYARGRPNGTEWMRIG
jgi:hypothetical protein